MHSSSDPIALCCRTPSRTLRTPGVFPSSPGAGPSSLCVPRPHRVPGVHQIRTSVAGREAHTRWAGREEVELTTGEAVSAALWGNSLGFPHLPVPLMVKWQEFESESLHFSPAPIPLLFTAMLLEGGVYTHLLAAAASCILAAAPAPTSTCSL